MGSVNFQGSASILGADGATDYQNRAGCFWIKINAGFTDFTEAWGSGVAANFEDDLYCTTNGGSLAFDGRQTGAHVDMWTIVAGEWRFFAFSITNSAVTLWWSDANDPSGTLHTDTSDTLTASYPIGNIALGGNSSQNHFLQCSMKYARYWNAPMTQAEFLAERASPTIVKTTGNYYAPDLSSVSTYTTDLSAAGVSITVIGSGATNDSSEPPLGPTITVQPAQQVSRTGGTATFSVTATAASGSLSYQWKRNGSSIGGATSSSYTTPTLTDANNGDIYKVDVTDSLSTLTSSQVYLIVRQVEPIAWFRA
jgi:hypothetical protein